MMKRLTAMILTAVLVITGFPGSVSAAEVTDINGHRSEAVIREAMSLGVIKGYPDGTYRPDGLIKREEFFSIINNVLTVKPDTSATTLNYIDVDPIEWYIPVVKTMVAAKITEGIGWGKVGIGLNITRQEAIKILATIIPTRDLSSESVTVLARDRDMIADWAAPYYQIMFKKGYLNNTEGTLGPTASLTREEAAILLLKIKKGETVIAGNANQLIQSQPTSGGCIDSSGHKALNGAFTEGKGTAADPYRISTEDQLNHMREHATEGSYFALTKNIRITKDFETDSLAFSSESTDWSGGNFRPIGTKENPFKGHLDGRGYTISGLKIMGTVTTSELADARVLASHIGLFGWVDEKSVITNLKVDDSELAGREYTGALAGYNKGIIKNSGAGENVVIRGGSYTGGLAGYSSQLVEYSFSKARLIGTTATGGLVGRNYGILRNSYWLKDTAANGAGASGMDSSVQTVSALTLSEFNSQNIEDYLKR